MNTNLTLAKKLKGIVEICEAADATIEEQNLIKKGALEAGKENDGIEPAVVRKILARRKKLAKDPAETQRLEDLMTDYQFMLGEGREDTRPWTQTDDEVSRVMALTNTSKPPKIDAIKKALGCSQGKAHKLRTLAATRLAKKSSSSRDDDEHEHSPPHNPGTGEFSEIHRGATQPKGCAKVVRTDASMSESVAASGDAIREASAMPLDVVAAPHSEGREHAGSAATTPPACSEPEIDTGTHSGGDAQDESCGEPVSAVGATAIFQASDSATAPLRPHDTHQDDDGCVADNGATARDGWRSGSEADEGYPGGSHERGLTDGPEVARAAPPVSLETRGEAPNPDGLDIPKFLRRQEVRL